MELHPPKHKQAEFTAKFGLTWPQALSQGVVYNAADAMDVRAAQRRGRVAGVCTASLHSSKAVNRCWACRRRR